MWLRWCTKFRGRGGVGINRKLVFKSIGWACIYSGVISQLSMFPVVCISGSFSQRCKFSYCSPDFHKVVTAYTLRSVWLLSSWFATEVSSPRPMLFFYICPLCESLLSGCEVAPFFSRFDWHMSYQNFGIIKSFSYGQITPCRSSAVVTFYTSSSQTTCLIILKEVVSTIPPRM